MSSAFHGGQTFNHVLENWTFANATDRAAGTGYTIVAADIGKVAYQTDTGTYWRLTAVGGLVWLQLSSSSAGAYDIAMFVSGKPAASQIVLLMKMTRQVVLPINLTGSVGSSSTNATSSSAFTLYKNGGSIGTATFTNAGSSPTFSFSGAVTFAINDVLKIVASGTQDATLSDVALTLLGTY